MTTIDADLLERLKTLELETDPQFLKELIDMYLASSSKWLTEIVASHQGNDVRKLHIGAHTLKGSSGNIGARRLAEICMKIEEATEKEISKDVGELIEMLKKEFENVQADLKAFMNGGKTAGQLDIQNEIH